MLRIRTKTPLVVAVALGIWSCAPRSTPAPVFIGGVNQNSQPQPSATAATSPRSPGQIVVQPGDTLIALARYHQAGLQDLVNANNLKAPYVIKPGQILQVPKQGTHAKPSAPAPTYKGEVTAAQNSGIKTFPLSPPETTAAARGPDTQKPSDAAPQSSPEYLDAGEDQTGGLIMLDEPATPTGPPIAEPKSTRVTVFAPSAAQPVRFLWPAKGPILSDFGPKQNGLHNDGINIAMPPNAPVHAAGNGVVSYAGNELRGYGNLLLIRHDGGWMTAYAHNSQLLVHDGQQVTRGQIIARAGRTGGVNQDQVHFEIRKNAKPVDPKPLLVDG